MDDWELRPEDLAPDGPVSTETWLGAPALSYPRRPPTVLDVLDRACRLWPARTAFLTEAGTPTSYADFAGLVEGAAQRLQGLGVRPGDSVALAARNSLDLAVALFACARNGAVLVGLNTRLAPAQWAYMLGHSHVRLALAQPEFLPGLQAAGTEVGATVREVGDTLAAGPPLPWSYHPSQRPPQHATYAVVYTSGTTGRPKASQVVHRCSVHSAMSYQRQLQLQPGDVTAVLFPLYYISAMHAHVLPAMLAGASCLLVETANPREYVDLLATHDVSWAYAVPSWWLLAVRVPGFSREQLPALTRVAAGGAPFPAPLVASLRERLPEVRLFDIYGLSETHSPATMLADDEFETRPGSVGRPLPCMQAEVRDEHGQRALAAGEAGELWVRGSLVTTGYTGDPDATAASIRAGWFDTGDIARIDADGYVTILDRSKDMINRGGTKIFSAEVEALLRRHAEVDDAAVVAVPDPLAGEAVVAFVVPRAGVTVLPHDVRAWVRDGMADYAAPRHVYLVGELPRNAIGKTDKLVLRLRARELTERG